MSEIACSDVLDWLRSLPDESVNCIVTSPPYFGLRDYGISSWEGGDLDCDHLGDLVPTQAGFNERYFGKASKASDKQAEVRHPYKEICSKCGAKRVSNQIGLESTPQQYVQKLVEIFHEARRVLRSDGTFFLNLGDSYAANRGYQVSPTKWKALKFGESNATKVPDGLKSKDLMMIPSTVATALRDDGWYLRSVIPWLKCISGGAVVYAKTQKGEMPMTIKDMVRLDPSTVKLWDGSKWNQVKEWHKVEPDILGNIELELRSGEKIGCTRNHVWPTTQGFKRADILQVGDILNSSSLPLPEKARFPSALDDFKIGWFVGLYIAEGSKSEGSICIASHLKETERFELLTELSTAYDGYCYGFQSSENGMNIIINSPILSGVLEAYVSGKDSHTKHLNVRCWKRSNRFLRAVLHGYLEGDGGRVDETRYKLGFTDNDALAQDLRTLSARLGCSLRLKRCKHTLGNQRFPGWRGDIVIEPERRKTADTEIMVIRRSRARKFYDIVLEAEPHTFVLASGVLTHNSNPMPESVRDRPVMANEYLFMFSKSAHYWYDAEAVRQDASEASLKRIAQSTFDSQQGGSKDYRHGTNGNRSARKTLENFAKNPGRSLRTTDLYFMGLLSDEVGDPLAIITSLSPSNWDYCKACDRLYVGKERKQIRIEGEGRDRQRFCVCGSSDSWVQHFASYPPQLIEPLIKAGCPEKVCAKCGQPYVRKIERQSHYDKRQDRDQLDNMPQVDSSGWSAPTIIDKGLQPACSCNASTRSSIVLDMFAGSGTTGLVAQKLGRDYWLCDLNPDYVKVIEARLQHEQPVLLLY